MLEVVGTVRKDRNSEPLSECRAVPFEGRMVFFAVLRAGRRLTSDMAAMAATAPLSWLERVGGLRKPGFLWDRLEAILREGALVMIGGIHYIEYPLETRADEANDLRFDRRSIAAVGKAGGSRPVFA